MEDFFKVASVDEIPPGGKKLVEVDFLPVAIFNIDGKFLAVEDVCTHDGGPLAKVKNPIVELDGDEIVCPRHGARFSVKTGEALSMPAYEPIECYEVKIEDGDILVSVD